MEMHYLVPFLCLTVLFSACTLDQCEKTITYVHRTPIYGDLNDYRTSDIISPARQIDNPGKIYVTDQLLLIGEKGEGVHVFDNSDPSTPRAVSFLKIPSAHEINVKDNYLYANSLYDLVKIDISDIQNISLSNRLELAFPAINQHGFTGEYIVGFQDREETVTQDCDEYVSFREGEIYYFDEAGVLLDESALPTSFVGNGQTSGTGNRMAFINDDLYVINKSNMFRFDVSGETLMAQNEELHYGGWNMETIYSFDNLLFVGRQDGLDILRVAGSNVEYVSNYTHATACDPVLPVNLEVAYLTLRSGDDCPGDENSLQVIDISNPSWLVLDEQHNLTRPYGMTLIGDELFVGEGEYGLSVFDATDRMNLTVKTHIDQVQAYDIIQHPSIPNVILLASEHGLVQYQYDLGQLDQLSVVNF